MSEPQAIETTGSSKSKGAKASVEERARDPKAERIAHVREQMTVLTLASWCTKPHNTPRPRPPSNSPVLDERRRSASEMRLDDIEGDRRCEECQQKLSETAAALALAVLPPTPTPGLLAAAKRLASEMPPVWATIKRGNYVELPRVLKRYGKEAFLPSEYQQMASESIAAFHGR